MRKNQRRLDTSMEAPDTLDTLFGGRIRVRQSRRGYRFSLDALLLASFARVGADERIVDLGTGAGVIPLALAYLYPGVSVTGVEIQSSLAARARHSVRLNGLDRRVSIVRADVRALDRVFARGAFGVVLCNPPYRTPVSGRMSPNMERQIARHEIMGTIEDFVAAGVHLLAAKGRMGVVYPALRCVDLLGTLRAAGLEPKRLRMVHSSTAADASLTLVEAVKGGRRGVTVMAPLVVYGPDGRYTTELAAMLGGGRSAAAPGPPG
jgi:tRNA1Val (adenine37-N6)-methyltransferase